MHSAQFTQIYFGITAFILGCIVWRSLPNGTSKFLLVFSILSAFAAGSAFH